MPHLADPTTRPLPGVTTCYHANARAFQGGRSAAAGGQANERDTHLDFLRRKLDIYKGTAVRPVIGALRLRRHCVVGG